MQDNRTPWALADFRSLRPDLPADHLEALLKVCNKAIELGLTREQVADTLTQLARTHPDQLPAGVLLEALLDQLDPEGAESVSDEERQAAWASIEED